VRQGLKRDLAVVLALFAISIAFFWPVTLGGKTLLPADNVFVWEPWASHAAEAGIDVPHNALLSDLYLQNYAWKGFALEAIQARQIPLWNPHILAGVPFLAAGQHSALYPLGLVFYILPVHAAYGWFAMLHMALAGIFAYALARTLGVRRAGSAIGGATFMLCGFMFISHVFPMIVAAAVWLPLIMVFIERVVRRAEAGDARTLAYIPDLTLGALAFGMMFLAGHPEMYYYVALSSGAFAAWRLAGLAYRRRSWRGTLGVAGGLASMALVGLALGAAQWVPLFDLVRDNFREGGATLREVLGWAYPRRRLIALLIPDFFGNPSHHAYFDLFSWRQVPATINALGQPINTIDWGIKNYVEGAAYLGTLPTLLAALGVLRGKGKHIAFFIALAAVSLLFAFGAPLYALVYYLPGLSQVHSPFRWIYPYSLCMAMLAAMGTDALLSRARATGRWAVLRETLAARAVPWAALAGGSAVLLGLGTSLLAKERAAALAERALHRLALAPNAFSDGRMFYSYQFRNLLIFGTALALGGLLLVLWPRLRRPGLWAALALLLVAGELYVIGTGFFPRTDSALAGYPLPCVEFLRGDADGPFRVTAYVGDGEKTFNANAGWMYGLEDIRGYDSIIPRQYVEYMELIQPQTELMYNRIAPIYEAYAGALDSPLLDMLNVRYVLADRARPIRRDSYTLVYDGEILIYRNENALPRAFLVSEALVLPGEDAAAVDTRRQALLGTDLRRVVILEESPERDAVPANTPANAGAASATIVEYTPNQVVVAVRTAEPAYLVLGDSYYEGWLAYSSPLEPPANGEPEPEEQSLRLYRANGNFRAVQVPAGEHLVRFRYSPDPVKFGFYISFLGGMVLALAMGLWGWRRFYREAAAGHAAQVVTKNTLAPITLSLVNKGIDMAFAMLMLRILGPVDAGQFALAVVVIGWFDILTNFGLNTLLTREVAKTPTDANRYLSNTAALRLVLWLVSIPLLTGFFLTRSITKPLEPATILAISLFAVGLLPSNMSASLSAVFNAYERMEIPASVTTMTTLLKVTLGTVALILGTGFVGLAGVSIVVNLVTMAVLYTLARSMLFRPRLDIDWGFQRRMFRISYPLMINLLLATLFFKVAMLLLEWLVPDPRVLGWYGAAYKYVDAVQVIPAYFTMALFPLMSRYAETGRDSLLRAYHLAVKLLIVVAIPAAWIGWGLAHEMITILGGAQYLPEGAAILQVMIWYMPIGFINSVTQYVLIALDQQRFLTRAFAIGLAFNVITNLILINRFGFMASAYVAVASELALLIPFYIGVRRHLAKMPWLNLVWKQFVSAAPMGLMFALFPRRYLPVALVLGLALYAAGLVLLRLLDTHESDALRRVLPTDRLRNRVLRLLGRPVDAPLSSG
jgi:O-antigen/teichoic acid export membrane protein